MKYVLGLTGGTGAGKSAAAEYFRKSGAYVIDADKLSHEVTGPGGEALEEIARVFPEAMENGTLNRRALGVIVFSRPERLKELNKITHRYIKKRAQALIEKAGGFIVFDAPLLYEAGCDDLCDSVIVVDADDEIRTERIMARDGLGRADAEKRVSARRLAPLREKADYVVMNNSGTEELYKELDRIMEGIDLG